MRINCKERYSSVKSTGNNKPDNITTLNTNHLIDTHMVHLIS